MSVIGERQDTGDNGRRLKRVDMVLIWKVFGSVISFVT